MIPKKKKKSIKGITVHRTIKYVLHQKCTKKASEQPVRTGSLQLLKLPGYFANN